ncbi:mucoidy inhibitor MuiA family protein, partial [bacterium]|nr:mucoidy inhibitor MuiA family protein [bacterium]
KYELLFKDLPAGILEDSIYATGKGSARAKILGLDIKRTFLEKPREEKIKKLEEEIQGLKDQDKALQDKIEISKTQDEFLKSIKVQMPEDISKKMLIQKPTVSDWRAILKFLNTNLTKNAQERLDGKVKRRELKVKTKALERELAKIRGGRILEDKSVLVTIEVTRMGILDLELSYVILGARWYPLYDARGQVATKEVELTYYGVVSQKTGEDWKDVILTLSTARPALGARQPEPFPWYLKIYEPPRSDLMKKKTIRGARRKLEALGIAKEVDYKVREEAMLEIVKPSVTNIEERGVSVIFNIKKKERILSDGTPHKTTIDIKKFPLKELEYSSIPRFSPYAYLKATMNNDTDYPLLAGKVNVFSEADYIGTSRINTVAPQEECELFLGVDEGIKVKRELISKKTKSSGKKQETTYAYKIEVENYKKEKETITIIDQIPVSQDSRIKVKLLEMSEEPTEEIEQGIIKWRFNLLPKGKKEITFSFSIEYSRGVRIQGL